MSTALQIVIVVCILVVAFGAAVVLVRIVRAYDDWLGPPEWQLSATNVPEGLRIELYEGDAFVPTYAAILVGRSTTRDVARAIRAELDPAIATTTEQADDDPRRWVLTIDGVRVDVSEDRLLIDEREVLPGLAVVRIPRRG